MLSHWSFRRMCPGGVGERSRLLGAGVFVLLSNLGVAWLCEALMDAFYPFDMSEDGLDYLMKPIDPNELEAAMRKSLLTPASDTALDREWLDR